MRNRLFFATLVAASALLLGGCDKVTEGAGAVGDLTSAFEDITGGLSGITDEASAQEAVPELESAAGALDGLTSKLDSLPDPVKETIQSKVGDFTGKFDELVEKAEGIPGVGGVIEGPVESIRGHLDALSG